MRNKSKKLLIFTVAFGLVVLIISQVWIYLSKEVAQKEAPIPNIPKTTMTTEERANAIKACVDGGLFEEMCACIVDKSANEFTLEEMGKMNRDMKEYGTSLEADMIVRECMDEFMPENEPNLN